MTSTRIIILGIFFCFISVNLFAEAVFLKNGTIYEGKIKSDTDKSVTITIKGKDKILQRRNILRVLYSDDYKNKKYIFLNDNSIIEAHIVEESRTTYKYRKRLQTSKETIIKKEQVKFISKEKISLAEMKQKKKKAKLISDRDNKFRNLLGVRLGVAYLHGTPDIPGANIGKRDGPLMAVSLYYYDKYFEFDWNFAFDFDNNSRTISHLYTFNLLPFNMFNVGIGFCIGYTKLSFGMYGNSNGLRMDYEGIVMGLMYRYEGWFRLGVGYIKSVGLNGIYNDLGTEIKLDDDGSDLNFYAFAEIFMWKNLSLSAHYYYTETNFKTLLGPVSNINFVTHYISVQVSFGLNIF